MSIEAVYDHLIYLMNESRVKDIWTEIVIFSTHECSQSSQNSIFSKQDKKQTTISSLYNLTFDRALALLLPL